MLNSTDRRIAQIMMAQFPPDNFASLLKAFQGFGIPACAELAASTAAMRAWSFAGRDKCEQFRKRFMFLFHGAGPNRLLRQNLRSLMHVRKKYAAPAERMPLAQVHVCLRLFVEKCLTPIDLTQATALDVLMADSLQEVVD